ncbi:PAS domain S-box protein [Calidithermus chliarophilus]|uniref:PAS domain S-box protein n=1 Tax=Calidithermus chliarophilus TaxID=52023 RepID=UPI00041EB85E|nr:PAS domain S-box protein [Calidithermus chliarophilus]
MDDGKAAGEPTPALENDFRLMFEAAGVGMVQVDPFTTRFLRVNRCFAEMTGYAAEELLGMSALELTHPDDRDRDRAEWEKTLWGESPQFAIEKRYVRKDGGVIWVSVVATVLRDAENHPLRAVSTVEDITERKRAEERLVESEARFRTLSEGLPLIVSLVHADGRIEYVNPWWSAFSGRSPEDFINGGWLEALHPGDRAAMLEGWQTALATGQPYEYEFRARAKDGTYRWLFARGVPIRNDAGEITRWVNTALDIHDRKEAEEALRASEERLAAILEQLPVGVGLMDTEGRWVLRNAALTRFVGKTIPSRDPEALKRWQVWDALGRPLGPTEWPGARALRGKAVSPGTDMLYTAPDGTQAWTRVSAAPFRDPAGEIAGAIAVVEDVTLRKRAEEALRASEERQSFLLQLTDAVRPLADPAAIQGEACRLLAERLGVERAYYVEVDEEAGVASVERDFVRGGVPSLAGKHKVADFSWSVEILRRGECHVIANTQASPLVPPAARPASAALRIIACMGAPLIKAGRLVGALCVTDSQPREWSEDEVDLLREVGERIWAAVERAKAERALRESEARLQRVISLETVGVLFFDPQGVFIDANDAFLRMSGLTREQIAQRQVGTADVTLPEWMPRTQEGFRELRETGRLSPYEKELRRPDGSRWWGLFAGARLSERENVEFVIDITERKRAEQDRAWLAALVESTSDAVVSFDLERVVLSWNPAAERMFGYAADEAVGQGLERFVPAGLEPEQAAIVERVRQGEHVVQHETFRLHKDGTPVPVSLTVSPIKDEHGAVIAATAIVQDIRERKRAEAALLESRERLALTLEAGSLGIWDSDLLTHHTYWSPEQERLFGLEPGSFDGGFSERLHPDDRERVLRRLAEVRAAGGDYEDEYRVVWPDGTVRWLAARGRVYRDPQGQAVRILGVNFDITRRKEAEEQLRASEARLQALVEAQKRFVADASHELRAPLMAIQGNLELVCRFPQLPEEEHRAALEDARNEANRMTRLVNDLLILARGDAGTRLRLESLDLGEVLREALAEAQHFARGRALEAELPGRLGLRGDRDRIKQLALILLENALKYTPEGGKVRLELAKDGRWAELRVRDTGIGIAAEHLPHVFERFWRADRARARGEDPGGTGLGLSIARWIVEQHGGRIWLESEVGKGTTAIVRLPLGAEM